MTEYTVSIEDDYVDEFIQQLRDGKGWSGSVADQLDAKRPGLPLPDRQQAVIRTAKGVGVLADRDSSLRWLFARDEGQYEWARDSEVGKVLEIIYEGMEVK